MAVNWDEFWGRAGKAIPGMFDTFAGAYGANAGANEAQKRLRTAQGPVYDASMQGAQNALGQAGNMDPNAFAQQRLNQNLGLLSGKDASDEDALRRSLVARGMLGAATYNPGVEGITPNGTAMNPELAAFYAAKNARNSKMATDSYDQGQKQIDTLVNRAGMLQRGAANTQGAGITAQGTQPSRTAANMGILKGLGTIGKDTGLFGQAGDWLKSLKLFGGGSDPYSQFSGGQGLNDIMSAYGDTNWGSVF